MIEDLQKRNEHLAGELSLVSNQKQLLDTLRSEVNQLRDHQRKLTDRCLEQEKILQQKEEILSRFRTEYDSECSE
jgi:murein tripeptide amidase MpaA